MSENITKPTYEVLPIDPENNPPETVEEIEELLSKMQDKTNSIKQQLEVVAIREKQGLEVDYERVKRALFARTQTNKSIAGLQRVLKKRKQQAYLESGIAFEKFFFESAKAKLSAEMLSSVMADTLLKMKIADSFKENSHSLRVI
jgi:hypothetical protein